MLWIAPSANLCLYWQRGSVRGLVKNEPQYNRLAFYESCNLDWVVGQYEAGCFWMGLTGKNSKEISGNVEGFSALLLLKQMLSTNQSNDSFKHIVELPPSSASVIKRAFR